MISINAKCLCEIGAKLKLSLARGSINYSSPFPYELKCSSTSYPTCGLGAFFSFIVVFLIRKAFGINLQALADHTQLTLENSRLLLLPPSLIALPTLRRSPVLSELTPGTAERRGGIAPIWRRARVVSRGQGSSPLTRSVGLKSDEMEASPGCEKPPRLTSSSLCLSRKRSAHQTAFLIKTSFF